MSLLSKQDPKLIAKVLGSRTVPNRQLTKVALDSRLVEPGALFFALKGERTHGHHFLGEAAARGAVAAVVDRDYGGPDFGLQLFPVEEGLQALQQLMQAALASQQEKKIVAVTGSVGKTTTKGFLCSLLSSRYRTFSPSGNHNSQLGLPLSILNEMDGDEELLVLEMGMTEAGNIRRLVDLLPPDLALITAIELVHACNFDSLSALAMAKGEIFSHPKTRLGFLPKGVHAWQDLAEVGICGKRFYSAEDRRVRPFFEQNRFRLPGQHNRHNAAAAITIALELKVEEEQIAQILPTLSLEKKRLQFVEKEGILFVDDSYNAAEVSVKAALETMPGPRKKGGRRIAVIGEMLELGNFSEECHRAVAEHSLKHVDVMFCLGGEAYPITELWQKQGRSVYHFEERNQLVQALKAQLTEGDVVLLKGSRSTGMWKVLDELNLEEHGR